MRPIAIVGAGFVGRGWAICFARSGRAVRIWDPVAGAASAARVYLDGMLSDLAEADLLSGRPVEEIRDLITVAPTMSQAVAGVGHVQENAPEKLSLKRQLFTELDAAVADDAVIASSTSALLPSAFTDHLEGKARCIVAHPVNPPCLIPLVEIVAAPWTDPEVITQTTALMRDIGQSPVLVKGEIDGFLLNRLQAAVLDEAFRLVDGGFADAEAVDACMRDGLALRWLFMGPFETIDLNAPNGVRDYVGRYHGMFQTMTNTMRHSVDWSGPVLDSVEADRRKRLPQSALPGRQIWRDRKLMELATFRKQLLADRNT